MKRYWPVLWMLMIGFGCQPQTEQSTHSTQLPFTWKQGYGPFYPNFGFLDSEHTQSSIWGKMYQPVKGRPKRWTQLTKSLIWLDAHQLIYQDVKAGRISPEHYQYLQREWKWRPDTTKLSATPIKCYVYVLRGFDECRHQWAVLVDTNGNLDFRDEQPYYPETIKPDTIPNRVNEVRTIHYEVYQQGGIKTAQLPIVVKIMGDQFVYNFPQYAVATLPAGTQSYPLFISFGFDRPDFSRTTLAKPASVLSTGKLDPDQLVEANELIEIGGVSYRNKGVDPFFNRLTLEASGPLPADAYSLQTGQYFHPFTETEFSHHTPLSLAGLKGKYVYIDFWGTWCAGCVAQLPHLKQLYGQVDKERVEFVGIVCHDSPGRLASFIQREHLAWPQLLSDAQNKLVDRYQVNSFPTSVLLDREGKIIARNLHGAGLSAKLKALTMN